MSEELKPCPFCGSNNIELIDHDNSIWCEDCPAGVNDYTVSINDLIEAWNTRINELSE